MSNLFSTFDPMVMWCSMSINWIAVFCSIIIIPSPFWLGGSQVLKFFESMTFFIYEELAAVFGTEKLPGTIFIFISFFLYIFLSNLMGLVPYIFTGTSHLVLTLMLAFPLWVGGMIWTILYQPNTFLAHLVPLGTPTPLMPVMVIIETVSSVIRPGTLSIRLAANMIAGHLLLTLLGSQAPMLSFSILISLMFGLILLMMLELAVACIQAYVFTILSALYLAETNSVPFSKLMV